MNDILKQCLFLSFSGSLLILILFAGGRLWKDRISRQWQYYIWLAVVFRLLVPVGIGVNLTGDPYQAIDTAIMQAAPFSAADPEMADPETVPFAETLTEEHSFRDMLPAVLDHIGLIWLAAALGLLLRKITLYQSFIRYINAGLTPVSDIETLNRLSDAAEQLNIRKPVELCVNPLVSSPLLTGFFHPCIVLPCTDIPGENFQYIVLHELTHYKRKDMLYKWLVQITVCFHWFNPLVHLMSREITRACEFSCDEAVLVQIGDGHAAGYGKTLLDAMAAVGKYRETLGAVTLSENKELLKERLGAIMNFRRKPTAIRLLTGLLTLCILTGAAFIADNSAAAADVPKPVNMETLDLKGTTYYLVQNESQLKAIGSGEYGMDRHYMQQANIQLSTDEWVPIGTWENPFTGTFNGNGFEITGLTMTDPNAKIIGLFGVAKKAHIYNVTLRDYDITSAGSSVLGKSVGAIVAVGQESRSYDNHLYPAAKEKNTLASVQAKKYYEAGSLPLFQTVFPRLTESEQSIWLDKIYADKKIAFFSVAVNQLPASSPQIGRLAEKIYKDGSISFFSVLANRMDETALETWLDKVLEDQNFSFQSMLFDRLEKYDEQDALEEELAQKQMEEYKKFGITRDGTSYYYQGKAVHVFVDHRPNTSAYTFGINPDGTVDIKTVYGTDGKIASIAYITEAEVTKLLSEFGANKPDDDWDDWDCDDDWDWWDDWDLKEEQTEKALAEAYASYGITKVGKAYYYKNKLVNIFLDLRPNKSFYTLDTNPAGTVNVKIIRDTNGQITGAARMTDAEAAKLLNDMK